MEGGGDGSRNRRQAERLEILLESSRTLIARLASLKNELNHPDVQSRLPWNEKQMKSVAQHMKSTFPAYPNLQSLDDSKGPEELRKRSKASIVCQLLERYFLAFYDSVDVREETRMLLAEIACEGQGMLLQEMPTLVAAFMNLLVAYMEMILLLSLIADKELIVCFYTYCFQYATDLPVTKYEPVANLFHHVCPSYDVAWQSLRSEFEEVPTFANYATSKKMSDFLQSLLFEDRRSTASQSVLSYYQSMRDLIDGDSCFGNSLIHSGENLQYPSGFKTVGELTYWMAPQMEDMLTWMTMGLLACPTLIILNHTKDNVEFMKHVLEERWVIECAGLQIWTHVEMYKIFHDKSFISEYEKSMSKQGFKAAKDRFKKSISNFIKNAPNEHRKRRALLHVRCEGFFHVLSDSPGLLGPQWFSVLSLLSLAKSETLWFLQHRELPTKRMKEGGKEAGKTYKKHVWQADSPTGEEHFISLLASLLRLKNLSLKFQHVSSDYFSSYLEGLIGSSLAQAAQAAEDGKVSQYMSELAEDLRQPEPSKMRSVRVDVQRLNCWIRNKNYRSRDGLEAIFKNLQRAYYSALVVEDSGETVFSHASLGSIFLWNDQLLFHAIQTFFEINPASCLIAVQVYDDMTRCALAQAYPEDIESHGKQAVTFAEDLLKRLCKAFTVMLRKLIRDREQTDVIGSAMEKSPLASSLSSFCSQIAHDCLTIRVFNRVFSPLQEVVRAVRQDLRDFLYEKMLTGGIIQPRITYRQLLSYLNSLSCLEEFASMSLPDLLGTVLEDVFEDAAVGAVGKGFKLDLTGSSFKDSTCLSYRVAEWYATMVVKQDVFFVPSKKSFVGPEQYVEDSTSVPSLMFLSLLVGPRGLRCMDRVLLSKIFRLLEKVQLSLSSNRPTLAKIAEDFKVHDYKELEGLGQLDLDDAFKALSSIGSLLQLRQNLHLALSHAMEHSTCPRALQLCVNHTGSFLRLRETSELDMIAYDMGGSNHLFPVDPNLQHTALSSGVFSREAMASGRWKNLELLLAGLIRSHNLRDDVVLTEACGYGGVLNGPAVGILALLILAVSNEPEEQLRDTPSDLLQERRVSHSIAVLVRIMTYLASKPASKKQKKKSQRAAFILIDRFIEHAEKYCPNVRKHAPSFLMSSAIQNLVVPDEAHNETNFTEEGIVE
ncbi:hypothetical protein GUITHDRAFT_160584 [Guillardia theta CCMP2712]|uniref:CYRIA/CYRIB Rac1 binding domain-containing protein n=1 Tax=Guillardia theta (strain CCMP2712) TaxID=905079 RepID=L1K3G7_GUITC|nr:hypothetical protein GUITHDRAFT_160584 [Guillardia theta CCMP2712]EKX55010.1 hypothetical protein GUITHDRAFT_160584 [Guillardia theta CCMP2712]|eukprot:XP_005841990.1 hypothetical protein GUITHDRAFT_160584 [Guillardia theta CCMP2712]